MRAGEEAEKQMAFYLRRTFAKANDYYVLNDLRIVHGGSVAQIDHLIVTSYGLFIIESKSVHGKIIVNEHNEWSRSYNNQFEGMPSPILQATAQGELLQQLLIDNCKQLLGKMLFGKIQKGFKFCPALTYIAISDSGIIERKTNVPELYKADQIASAINKKIKALSTQNNLLSLNLDVAWEINKNETKNVADFLLSRHEPLISKTSTSQAKVILNSEAKTKKITTESPSEESFIPKVGAICPKCKQHKLIRKSVPRSDGTETDFLACAGYPIECKTIFALVALVKKIENVDIENKTLNESDPCPYCKDGKLVIKKGIKGKSDFFACSLYAKTKCNFQKSIN